ncbi:hypothetical protein C0995_015485, partial [Termitomyces sp. Mi166
SLWKENQDLRDKLAKSDALYNASKREVQRLEQWLENEKARAERQDRRAVRELEKAEQRVIQAEARTERAEARAEKAEAKAWEAAKEKEEYRIRTLMLEVEVRDLKAKLAKYEAEAK